MSDDVTLVEITTHAVKEEEKCVWEAEVPSYRTGYGDTNVYIQSTAGDVATILRAIENNPTATPFTLVGVVTYEFRECTIRVMGRERTSDITVIHKDTCMFKLYGVESTSVDIRIPTRIIYDTVVVDPRGWLQLLGPLVPGQYDVCVAGTARYIASILVLERIERTENNDKFNNELKQAGYPEPSMVKDEWYIPECGPVNPSLPSFKMVFLAWPVSE